MQLLDLTSRATQLCCSAPNGVLAHYRVQRRTQSLLFTGRRLEAVPVRELEAVHCRQVQQLRLVSGSGNIEPNQSLHVLLLHAGVNSCGPPRTHKWHHLVSKYWVSGLIYAGAIGIQECILAAARDFSYVSTCSLLSERWSTHRRACVPFANTTMRISIS
jgi:hypothetical protein